MIFTTILAVIFMVWCACSQCYYAQSMGYKLKPTACAYFIGALGNLFTGSIVPLSGQAEVITLSGQIKNHRERLGALLLASLCGIVTGLTRQISSIVEFAGSAVINGMMAGVGFILAFAAINIFFQKKRTGAISIAAALLSWYFTKDMVYCIAVSVLIPAFDFCVLQKRRVDLKQIAEKAGVEPESSDWRFWRKDFWYEWRITKPLFNLSAALGGLGLICLNIGANISFGNINASIAKTLPMPDELTFINSLADIPSIMFGGMPIEAIISGTAAAPYPLAGGIILMLLCGGLILTGLVSKLGRFIPAQSVSGFILVIGIFLTIVPNINLVAHSEDPYQGIIAMGITAATKNAFIGLAAATAVRITMSFF